MAKYEVDRFQSPPDPDLVCCICQCVLDKPLESPCQHVFCKVCIETWLTNRKNCPNCRKRLRISKLKPVLPIVRNMINRLIIKCDNYSHGCVEGIKLEYYDTHVNQCGFVPLKCMNTGCEVTVLRKDMLAHENECLFRLVICKKGCGFPVSAELRDNHSCVQVLKMNMEGMEETFNKKFKALSEQYNKLHNKMQKLEAAMKQQISITTWDSSNDDNLSNNSGTATPTPVASGGEDDANPNTSPTPREFREGRLDEDHMWRETASDDSFITGRGTPVNHEEQNSRSSSSWFNSDNEGPDQTDVGDLEESAVDALLASDADNSVADPSPGSGGGESNHQNRELSSGGGYETQPVDQTHEDSRQRENSSEHTSRDPRRSHSRSRTYSRRRSRSYSMRGHHLSSADSTSNVNSQHYSDQEDGYNDDDTPAGSPVVSSFSGDSDASASERSSAMSTLNSLHTSDTSPPSSPVSFNDFLNNVAQLDSQSDFTWTPSPDSRSQDSSEQTYGSVDNRNRTGGSPNDEDGRRGNSPNRDNNGSGDGHRRGRRRCRVLLSSSDEERDNDGSNSVSSAKKMCRRRSWRD